MGALDRGRVRHIQAEGRRVQARRTGKRKRAQPSRATDAGHGRSSAALMRRGSAARAPSCDARSRRAACVRRLLPRVVVVVVDLSLTCCRDVIQPELEAQMCPSAMQAPIPSCILHCRRVVSAPFIASFCTDFLCVIGCALPKFEHFSSILLLFTLRAAQERRRKRP